MTTLEIKHRVLTTVDSTNIQLPYYWSHGKHAKSFCVMTTEFTCIDIRVGSVYLQIDSTQYDDSDDATYSLERSMMDETFERIDEAVFMHHFSLCTRKLYDLANPKTT